MKIGLNLLYLLPGVVGGTEIYAAGLMNGLAQVDGQNEYFVFVNRECTDWKLPEVQNFIRVICPVSAASRAHRYFFEQFRLPLLLKSYRIELIHSLGYVSPLWAPCESVVTIYDLNYLAFGEHMPVVRRQMLAFFVPKAAHKSVRVITSSGFSKKQIINHFKLPLEKVVVIGGASDAHGIQINRDSVCDVICRLKIHPPYVVAFSSGGANKNIPRLLGAFALASLPYQLVLIGRYPEDQIPQSIRSSVVLTGYLNDVDHHIILSGADFLVVPSTYEGFGLPVLEAQQRGVPVICSNAASLPEVAGDAAVYFDPYSVDDMAKQIVLVATNRELRAELRQKGLENAARFSWVRTAQQTLEVYRNVLNARAI
jgi:glycosyltransferase involved in cell wall biosynthesis